MKTLSVKQVAECLGVSPRAVIKRLNNQQLKGTRRPNKFGVEEWWVYPNKEIRSALEAAGKSDILSGEELASDAEIVDVFTENFSPDQDESDNDQSDISDQTTEDMKGAANGVAEELWNNIIGKFVGQLQERDQLIGEMRSEIAEKDRQLKLLPDLQKAAEKERQEAQLRALESEALKKQISALQEQVEHRIPADVEKQLREEKEAKEAELASLQVELEKERKDKEKELSAVQAQLAAIEEYKKIAEESKARLDQLQKTLEEQTQRQEAEKAAALEEVKRLQEEKSNETAAIREELAALSKKLEKPQQTSWLRKWFSWGSSES
jgi:chromosome segregation ATPase